MRVESLYGTANVADSSFVGEQCVLGYPKEARLLQAQRDSAAVSCGAPVVIGERCLVFNHVILYEGVRILDDCVIEDHVRIGYDSTIGPRTRVVYGAYLCDRVTVGADACVAGFVCCGSGTILAEALASGWAARGRDIDRTAVAVARQNVPKTDVQVGDARTLDQADDSVGACVSNLPFGRRFSVQGDMNPWLRTVLAEMARVTRPGGRVVLLAPDIPGSVVPSELLMRERFEIRLLGTKTTIWAYDRT